ncbi:DotH/IcmK family type IV secretion protein [Vibrio alginolyticus]|uniref:DotH/IcmK family type IV secretion protein n=1 Tax=Vibrio alginolyticus TaxID=663 RepID=UPI0006CA7AC2|nr:DotH/IcmK family type IV secretion protein [Vibrio alginolyticus]KPM98498.1 hypothetical protein AOG25_08620 [Vibrio alginolyticus]CAH7145501.1 conserved exported hypothetical protein [Vibrio chagasii]CAH7316423.1 conserved exported hypothetical protein [Vibrio chagasii]
MLKKTLSISIVAVLLSSTAFANSDKSPPPPLKLKEYREKEIRDLGVYQLSRRLDVMSSDTADNIKRQVEENIRQKQQDIRSPDQKYKPLSIDLNNPMVQHVVKASVNYMNQIVVLDKYGNPWKIKRVGIGATEFFGHEKVDDHIIWVWPKKKYKESNIALLLEGETKPVNFKIVEGPDKYDSFVELKIQGVSPNSNVKEFEFDPLELQASTAKADVNQDAMLMADGITPDGAERLSVTMQGSELDGITAWSYRGEFYIRFSGSVISPQGKLAAPPSSTGLNLYRIPKIDEILIEKNGLLMNGVQIKNL